MTDALYWLVLTAIFTALQPLPYILERLGRIGLFTAMGYSQDSGHGDSNQPTEQTAHWAKRAYRAHYNSVEYLAVLAILVLTAHLTNNGAGIVATATMVYFFARIAHYIIYILGIPVLRTLSFAVSLGALLTIAYTLLTNS